MSEKFLADEPLNRAFDAAQANLDHWHTQPDTSAVANWQPPVIYDYITDRHRVVTQDDVDELVHARRMLGELITGLQGAVRLIGGDLQLSMLSVTPRKPL